MIRVIGHGLKALPLAACILLASPVAAHAEMASLPDADIPTVLIALAVILLSAKVGGALAARLRQPTLLGELLAGVVLGNMALIGIGWVEGFGELSALHIFAEIGVIILLFQVGLESDPGEMLRVGLSSALVATLGVIGPFLLGWGVGLWFYPDASIYAHLFLGAILTATSVGITARVLRDLGKLNTNEARIILGAAVIDDILGLLILAVVSGIIQAAGTGSEMSSLAILWLVGKALLFLAAAIVLGRNLYPYLFRIAHTLRVHGILLVTSLAACFFFAFLADRAGLSPIIGAFAAGLVLDIDYRNLPGLGFQRLEELLEPVAMLFIPVFFVQIGMNVDLATFRNLGVLGFALVLTIAAILGKQMSAFGVVNRPPSPANRWIVGLGMIPRGEVGLIFAGIGAALSYNGVDVVSPEIYSAVVIMVFLTTMVTPPALTWAFNRPMGQNRKVKAAAQRD